MAENNSQPVAPRVPRRVLVVEDEKNQRQMLVRTISEMEFEVAAAGSGEEALRMIEDFSPTVAILDLNLPGINGLELARAIQERLSKTRMIVLTGYGDLDAARQAMRLDVVDFLLKPCPLGELETAVSRAYQKAAESSAGSARAIVSPIVDTPGASNETETIGDAERRMIAEALTRNHGNRAAVARELGISVRTLYYRLSRYEIEDQVSHKRQNMQH